MSVFSVVSAPGWFFVVPEPRQGHWVAGDRSFAITGQTLTGYPVRILMKNGEVLDGVMGGERNRWDPKHSVAIRIPGRKTQKWVKRVDIAEIWGDKGPRLEELLTAYLNRNRG